MDDPYILNTYMKLKEMNSTSSFNLYDYIYYEFSNKTVNPDVFYAIYELFWPTFIIHKEHVILKETFNHKYFEELETNSQHIEYWMNFVSIDPYFAEISNPENQDNESYEKCREFTRKLSKLWKMKLTSDFPEKNFVVDCLDDEDTGDVALTFYQKTDHSSSSTLSNHCITFGSNILMAHPNLPMTSKPPTFFHNPQTPLSTLEETVALPHN